MKVSMPALIAAGALFAAGAAFAAAEPPPTPAEISVFQEGSGYVYKTEQDLAVYTYANDPIGQSKCVGPCAKAWPPVEAPADAHKVGDWTPITREGGARQWAYKGKPVYTYSRDTPESFTGDGVGGVWKRINP
jgi:predicted lipoprotein with Yx(FWY)xxD motif